MMSYDLERFKSAQSGNVYERALDEVRRGEKTSHWMWFIFTQIKGLGMSPTAQYYGIDHIREAKAYLEDTVLGGRLREICAALLEQPETNAEKIFGFPDCLKLRSCMTLFDMVSPNDVFARVLDRFYGGKRDSATISIVNSKYAK